MASRILALLIALCICPAVGEAAEYAVHWVQDGDSVHAPRHHDGAAEHDGCADHLCHLTSCACTGALSIPPAQAAVTAIGVAARPVLIATETPAGLGCAPPATRPPIA